MRFGKSDRTRHLLTAVQAAQNFIAGCPTSTSKRFLPSRFARRPRGSSSTSAPTLTLPPTFTENRGEPALPSDWIDDFVLITHRDLPIQLDNDVKPNPDPFFGAHPSKSLASRLSKTRQLPQPPATQRVQLADLCLDFPQPPTYIPTPTRALREDKPPSRLNPFTRLVRSSLPRPPKQSPSFITSIFKAKAHPSTSTDDESFSPVAPTPHQHKQSFGSSIHSLFSPTYFDASHSQRPLFSEPGFNAAVITPSTISRNSSTSRHTRSSTIPEAEDSRQVHSDFPLFLDNTYSPSQHYRQPSSANPHTGNHHRLNHSNYLFPETENIKQENPNQTTEDAVKMFDERPLRDLADYGGKRTDVVDLGGEVDYGDHTWFQDPPERPAPPTPQPEYTPAPEVIQMNDAYEYALSYAPNVVYARYKQYGQLGVLAWCSEFSELIDGLKQLGFEGNMFTTTRAQALGTCSQLLKLPMEIDMQLIVIYLSSQVSRLRHFLDSETVWNDYPMPKFPVHPPQVSLALPVT